MTKPFAPSCERNQGPILEVLQRHLAEARCVLEIGSGTGQHAVHFAAAMPWLTWQSSDRADNLPGIAAWLDEAALPNTPPAVELDVDRRWPAARFDAVFTANSLHIMGWPQVEAFFAGVGGILERNGLLIVYGPFNYGGDFTSDSNRAFEQWLKDRDPASGIRDFEAVDALARAIGLALVEDNAMPANNRCLVWRSVRHAHDVEFSDAS
ncbi:MAG: class I SAM-dependent methyltransferase [Pseudoxanthomonas sp.]|nr:class I SAM-dependent methyltransferase [Pseudoxanthomonas sp.]